MDVLIAGATGLVGRILLQKLQEEKKVSTIYVLSRRAICPVNEKTKVIISDYEDLEEVLAQLPSVSAIFSCLGTTKSKTPDKVKYEKIEIQYPSQLALWAGEKGVQQFHYISSLGASVTAKNEYLSRKGLAEQRISKSNISDIYFYRPSLIVGERKDNRLLEKVSAGILKLVNPLLIGGAKKYRSIRAEKIATAMLLNFLQHKRGIHVLQSDQIEDMA